MNCPGCGRSVMAASGGLDLLSDDSRDAADRFALAYRKLRTREGWADADGREDPSGGNVRLWRSRFNSMSRAAAILRGELSPTNRPVIADVGSGGAWVAPLLTNADVLAIDLMDIPARPGSVTVRADMRNLPLRNASIDAALYAASLHYSPVENAVREAARVLRPGGLMVTVDSPIYPDTHAQARASARSTAYYAQAGFPQLANHYYPIEAGVLHSALVASGFDVIRLDGDRGLASAWRRLARRPPSSLVVARLSS